MQGQIFVTIKKTKNRDTATSKNIKYRGSVAAKIGNIAAVRHGEILRKLASMSRQNLII
jgi:hypothetical protein